MKLIDLLVQELPKRGGWPEGVHSITQDDDGSVFLWAISGAYPKNNSWRHPSGCGLLGYWCGDRGFKSADDRNSAYISAEQYEGALAESKQAEWDGVGLPPVGCECEFFNDDRFDCRPSVPEDGTKVKIVAHEKSKVGIDVAVFTWFGADNSLHAESCTEMLFRPIRTEAERKREEAGLAIYHAINWNAEGELVSPSRMEDYRKAYDAIAAGKIPGVKLDDI